MTAVASPFTLEYSDWKEGKNNIYHVIWTLPNFDNLLQHAAAKEFRTPVVVDTPASKFQLKMLSVRNQHDRPEDSFELYFSAPSTVNIKTEVSLHATGNICFRQMSKSADYQTIIGNKWQFLTKFCRKDLKPLFGFPCSSELICDIKFTVLRSEEEDLQVRMNERLTPQKTFIDRQLFEDFANLLADETFSDVTLKSVEGEECRAHKAVLATRSQVLKAHFEHNTTEAITNVIETPFEYEVLRDVLAYIYTSKATRIDDIPDKLFVAADYYQLSALKSLCEEAIHRRLTVENAIETLQLAELHSVNSLKQSTLEFIKPQVHMIIKTEAWAKLQSATLIKKILEYVHGSS